ncbi:MAG: AIR synthase-related protein, partial [Planctomycetota bacterium]|nr:AIR synthase-related protein [Planctomycetota bacterium]
TMDFKGSGHALVLVGDTGPELGGSHLARHLGTLGTEVPPVDLETAPATLLTLHHLLNAGLAVASHDLSEGGLGVAAAEMGFAGGVGAEIDLSKVPCRGEVDPLVRLYGESPTRFLLEVETDRLSEVEAALGDIPHSVIGETTEGDRFTVRDGDTSLLDQPIESLRQAFLGTLDFDRGEDAP